MDAAVRTRVAASPLQEVVADLGGLVPLHLGRLRALLVLGLEVPLLLRLLLGARALVEVRLARTDPGGRQSAEDRGPVESRLVPGLDPGQEEHRRTVDLGLPERAASVAQSGNANPVRRALRDIALAGVLLRRLAPVGDLDVATDALHLLRPEADICLVDEEPGLRPVHLNQLTDETPVVPEALRIHALQEEQRGLKDQPGLPPRVEVRGARKLDPLPNAGLYLVRERRQCELLECPLAVGTDFHHALKSGGPGSSTLFQVPASTWYENDTSVSFLSALLP